MKQPNRNFTNSQPHMLVVGAGIGGLTTGTLLANLGYNVTVLEAHTYPGGCAATFYHKGYRFEAGATIAGGFQPNGPHALIGGILDIDWPVHRHDPAWVVHFPDRQIKLCSDNSSVLAEFPETESFWKEQNRVADLAWEMAAQGLPWPPQDVAEFMQIARVGLTNFPADLQLLPFAFRSVRQWLKQKGLAANKPFTRFLDAQLLISAQATTSSANALYGATALDLPRQGVYHLKGGIGALAETLARKLEALGGEIRYRHQVTRIKVKSGRVMGVYAHKGRRSEKEIFIPCDFLIANLTPWSLDELLAGDSPKSLQREVRNRNSTWGAFALHLGVKTAQLPTGLADHHQIIADMDGPLGEGRSIFISMSPEWDTSRAPDDERAVTMTTHTRIQPWWDAKHQGEAAYEDHKAQYTEQMLANVEAAIPGFRKSITFTTAGTPTTFQYYTGRHGGMVGGFPQTSLFKARGPRTGIPNLRLVGDSIFPGQSTAAVSLGAMRVARDVQRQVPIKHSRHLDTARHTIKESISS